MSERSLTSERALPNKWIQKIFATMQGHYGSRFLNMWKTGQVLPDGTDAGVLNAMDHWKHKLAGWAEYPETIKRTLENLPVDPPSLPQFCEMMRLNHIKQDKPALTYELSSEQIAANKARLKQMLSTLQAHRSVVHDMEHD